VRTRHLRQTSNLRFELTNELDCPFNYAAYIFQRDRLRWFPKPENTVTILSFYHRVFRRLLHATNTCFHLAEYRRSNPPIREFKIVREQEGKKTLERYKDVDTDSSIFEIIGADFEAECFVRKVVMGKQRVGSSVLERQLTMLQCG